MTRGLRLLLPFLLLPASGWAQTPVSWQLVYSSDFHGELKPCGCSAEGDLGGILRRASKLAQLRKQTPDTVVISAGDILGEATEQGRIKNRYMLLAQHQFRLDALLPGERDLQYGAPAAAPELPWVLTNGQRPHTRAVRTRTLSSGTRVHILGVLAPELVYPGEPGLSDPLTALGRHRPEHGGVVIVMVHGPPALAAKVRQLEWVDLVVRGHLDEAVAGPPPAGPMAVLAAGHRGQRLGVAQLATDARGTRLTANRVLTLPGTITDDPTLTGLYRQYDQEVIKWFRQKTHLAKAGRGKGQSPFATDTACGLCHTAIHRQWRASRHARALASLERAGKLEDPECLACHTTGMNRPGGFIAASASPELANVQCEACHGAARQHAGDPMHYTPRRAMAACGQCHTRTNSPGFDLARYWKKIRHAHKHPPPIHRQALALVRGIYDVIDPKRPVLDRGPIEVLEFFNFYCSRCYLLERGWNDLVALLDRPLGGHRQVPIIFGDEQQPWAGIGYHAAARAGKANAYKRAVFRAKFEQQADIGDRQVIIGIAETLGIGPAVRRALADPGSQAAQAFNRGMDLRQRYQVTVTPTLVLNDNLRVLPKHTGDNTELLMENLRDILLDMQCRQSPACTP